MRWLQFEYILKGVFLGLLLFVALQEPNWDQTGKVALCILGGLGIALVLAGLWKVRLGYRIGGRLPSFILFLLMESSGLVYSGIILGTLTGALLVRQSGGESWRQFLLPATVGGGAALGLLFWVVRHLRNRTHRVTLGLLIAVALVAGLLTLFGQFEQYGVKFEGLKLNRPELFGIHMLLGIPVFYLLTFAGVAEESEVEIAAMCAAMGVAVWLLKLTTSLQGLAFLLPLTIYFVYSTRVLPGLRVFKYCVRGISYAQVRRYRAALICFRRALELDPKNRLARDGLWSVHRSLDLSQVADDPATLGLLNLDLCLDRAGALLLDAGPSPAMLTEAHKLLDLVENQRPGMRPAVDYWRAVAGVHAQEFEAAAAALTRVLDPHHYPNEVAYRESVLLPAWQLALVLHPEMIRLVGNPQLGLPGRHMEAIGAVERHLTANPDDKGVWDLKRMLYSGLTAAEFEGVAGADTVPKDFDYAYTQQLGLALINDPARWQRGAEYLRMAARGLPSQGPSIFIQIAQAHAQAGHADEARHNYDLVKRVGRAVGPKNLTEEDRLAYFSTLKHLAEDAAVRGEVDAAIENYQLYTEYERSGVETLKHLCDLYENKRPEPDVVGALRTVERALVYDSSNKELLERKDRYYYSVTPEQLQAHKEDLGNAFDVAYCLKKARGLLDVKAADKELVDWGLLLAQLALVMKPESIYAKVLQARAHLRRREFIEVEDHPQEREKALALLEDVYHSKPDRFGSTDDEEAWYLCCRLLGEMYLYEVARPDLAIPCFTSFKQSHRSGADTIYKMGQAYEQLGDNARAKKCYELVTAYEAHPLAYEARAALYRIGTN